MDTTHPQHTPTVRWADPKDLQPHHLNRAMPRITANMPQWEALFDDIRERGIQEPIRVISGRLVVDGETRRQVALAIPLSAVPVIDVPEHEGITTLVEHLCLQKHLGQGQRAYLCYHLAKGLEEEVRERRLANLRKGISPKPTESASGNIGDFAGFCRRYGFSEDVFRQARTLHKIFEGDPQTLKDHNLVGVDSKALRAEWEPKILSLEESVGLGRVFAGIAGCEATEGKEKKPNPAIQLDLFEAAVTDLSKVAKAWPKLRTDSRPEFVATWAKLTSAWPKEFRIELARVITRDVDGWESGT